MLRRIGGFITAAGFTALLAGCDVGKTFRGFGWPTGVSQQATQMYDLWIGSVVAALAVGFFVWGLIFWCVVRYRKRGQELPVQTRFNLPIEVLYTVLPFLVIAVLFYYTAVVQTRVTHVSANPDTTVEVVAFKWNWQFNYRSGPTVKGQPAPQTIASTTGTSEVIPLLVLPVGEKIKFELTAKDVIHSFWVPDLLFKRDVFPGSVRNEFEVTIDVPGRYVGRCAELCGTYHSMMNFEVVAVEPDRFDRYVEALRSGKTQPEAMAAIGFTGKDTYAVTTSPFPTKRDSAKEAGQ
ncbi:cytochrome c oxidase subunit II [Allorhizocola rhizosphaerae]|uniref:aa3-type cytochrome oxidase subunit II n=1 Tax=Allorhizocola rhizosphaerae TaxID=1872709 RepID=UPI001FE4DF35|nr:cytochrome c oxidase subunit II [Allorhizocola rhizosphaerae]